MRTYTAMLRGDRLDWLGQAPESQTDAPLRVCVTIVEPVTEAPARGPAMALLLEKLAARGTFAAIPDPVKWQRVLREDRALPGREG
ncbi:MAG: hypothetical protein FJ276_32355 [Planctomycetes bacterium]|nr:hypothetical protein [Planctomycetota bacterium]